MSSIALWVCWTAEIHRPDHNDCTFLVVMKVKGGKRGDFGQTERKLHCTDYTTPQPQTLHNKCALKHNNSGLGRVRNCECVPTLTAIVVLLSWVLRWSLQAEEALSHGPLPPARTP